MKKFICILLGLMMSIFLAQAQEVSKRLSPGDSVKVTVKFEKAKLTKDETDATVALNSLIANSMVTTGNLSKNLDHLATVFEDNLKLVQRSKTVRIAEQLGITQETINRDYKRNTTFLLVSCIPVLCIAFWAMGSFLMQKNLDIKHLLQGTAIMALYGILGSGALYIVLSLIFNRQYFVIKDLMTSMF
jgi:uncharacterized membrane protein YwzB